MPSNGAKSLSELGIIAIPSPTSFSEITKSGTSFKDSIVPLIGATSSKSASCTDSVVLAAFGLKKENSLINFSNLVG